MAGQKVSRLAAAAAALVLAGTVAAGKLTPAAWASDGSAPAGAETVKTGSAGSAPAGPSAAALAELEQLMDTVRAHEKKVAEHIAELESERGALAEDLEHIVKLEEELAGGGGSPVVATVAAIEASPSAQSNDSGTSSGDAVRPQNIQTQGSVDKRLSDLEARLKKVGPLSFGGDFRLREEPFFGGPADRSLDQNRQRIRARLFMDADLGAGVTGGFAFASGDVNNPISTNQDITAFYTRKPFELDRAFVQYTPQFFKAFSIVGGKFTYPWFNTELTWDKDLNPEGLGETLAFDLKTPVLKRIAIVAFELPFAQVSGVSLQNRSLVQSATYGAQVQSTWQLTPWATFSAYEALYDFHNADPIALALAKANTKSPATPFDGVLPLVAGSTTQNSITTTTSNGIVTVNGAAAPTGVATVTNAQFNSKFALLDSIARLDFKTFSERWPLTFIGDYVQNTLACANVGNILAKPANTSTTQFSQSTNSPCDPRARHAYWGEVQFGRILERHDLQFGYTRIYIEREAVPSNFDYSEIRQGSNVSEHRASMFYTVNRNIVLDFIALIGRPLNSSKPKPAEPFLDRLQVDVNYAF